MTALNLRSSVRSMSENTQTILLNVPLDKCRSFVEAHISPRWKDIATGTNPAETSVTAQHVDWWTKGTEQFEVNFLLTVLWYGKGRYTEFRFTVAEKNFDWSQNDCEQKCIELVRSIKPHLRAKEPSINIDHLTSSS